MTNKEWLMQGDNLLKALERVAFIFDQSEISDCVVDVLLGKPPYPDCSETEDFDGPIRDSCETCIRKWLKKDFIERMEEE